MLDIFICRFLFLHVRSDLTRSCASRTQDHARRGGVLDQVRRERVWWCLDGHGGLVPVRIHQPTPFTGHPPTPSELFSPSRSPPPDWLPRDALDATRAGLVASLVKKVEVEV
jgi:hypothetical protein